MRERCLVLAVASLLATQARSEHRRKSVNHHQTQPALTFEVAAVENTNQPQIQLGDRGSGVLRAQILLARARFSCGEIDGSFGTNLQTAIRAFQHERGLPTSGVIDAATWSTLGRDTAPTITVLTTAAGDVEGPFVVIPAGLMKQADLPALGYTSPLEALSERFHTSPAVMRALNPRVEFNRAGQALNVPNALTMPPGAAARIIVSRGESSVRALDASGKLLTFYVATTGSEHDPLPVGEWKIRGVKRNPKFHYNAKLFWDAKAVDDRATIAPGPNNPVGVVWIDLSKDHYGIHGTPEPSEVGHVFSHGCIRLTNWDATELASMVKFGTPATLQE